MASLVSFLLFCLIFLGTSGPLDLETDTYISHVPFGPELQSSAHDALNRLPKLPRPAINTPNWLNPFHGPAHIPPPEQTNSSSGEARWYADFKWRSPFSSTTTLDEQRAVLPPLAKRAPVYTYFDANAKPNDEKSKKAKLELLQVWRRAWWAQGFKPVVLSKSEAMNNPLYRSVAGLGKLQPEMESEIMRWLAWGNMGTGILCNWLAVPMDKHDAPLLSFLRRAEYPELTRYEGLENGIFVGSKEAIEAALRLAFENPSINITSSIADAVPPSTFTIDKDQKAIAFYSADNIKAKYTAIHNKLSSSETIAEGLAMLPQLINSHLHMTWQNTFSSGIAVLKPLPEHTTSIIQPAVDLARNLTQCADTPIPASCPPNRPRCKPCVSSNKVLGIHPLFRNTSTLFTIATVPHPYTMTSLLHKRDDLNVKFIRRETGRDPWILAATKELLGNGLSSFSRLPAIKDAIASDYGHARSLWLTAEMPPDTSSEKDLADLDWTFGFTIPRTPMPNGHSETPVPGPERRPPPPKDEFGDLPQPSDQQLERETALLEKAKMFIGRAGSRKGVKTFVQTREIVEAWNLADTETWKFVRAWNARQRLERTGWEEEEEAFQGKGTFDRWVDKLT